jgi:hypothetical protein
MPGRGKARKRKSLKNSSGGGMLQLYHRTEVCFCFFYQHSPSCFPRRL